MDTWWRHVEDECLIMFNSMLAVIRLRRKAAALTWRRSFTLSIGATAVLEMAAEIPPAKKSLANEIAVSFMVRCSWCAFSDNQYSRYPHCPLQLMACTDEMADCKAALRIYPTQWLAIQCENFPPTSQRLHQLNRGTASSRPFTCPRPLNPEIKEYKWSNFI